MTLHAKNQRRSNSERKGASEQAFIRAAIECIARDGLDRFTLDEVAVGAGRSRALVGYYFDEKQGLVERVLDTLLASPELQAFLKPKRWGLIPLLDSLDAYLASQLNDLANTRALSIIEAQALFDRRITRKLAPIDAQILAVLEAHLQAGLDTGEVGGWVNARIQAVLILAGLKGVIAVFLQDPDAARPDLLKWQFNASLERVIASDQGHDKLVTAARGA